MVEKADFIADLMNNKEISPAFQWLADELKKEPDASKHLAIVQKEEDFINACIDAAVNNDDYAGTALLLQKAPDAMKRVMHLQDPFWGGNLLHMAASNGCQRSIFALLEAKFDTSTKCIFGHTALESAARSGNNTTIAILNGQLTAMPASKLFVVCS